MNRRHEELQTMLQNRREIKSGVDKIKYDVNYGNLGYYQRSNGEVVDSNQYHLPQPKIRQKLKNKLQRPDIAIVSHEQNQPGQRRRSRKSSNRDIRKEKNFTPQPIGKGQRLPSLNQKQKILPNRSGIRSKSKPVKPRYVYKRPDWWG